jgi:superfamily I DNA/RNA helicase
MPFLIPGPIAPSSTRAPEADAKVLAALAAALPAEDLVYANTVLTDKQPTFIVSGPSLGVVLLDVHGWRPEALLRVTATDIEVREVSGVVKYPLDQLKLTEQAIMESLRAHPGLMGDGGQARCRVGHALVLPWLTRADVEHSRSGGTTLAEVLGPHGYLTGDDLDGTLASRLHALVPVDGRATTTDVDAVRAAIYPALTLRWGSKAVVLDPDQDRLARLPDLGHYVVEGPAGSGKTLTLMARAKYLRERHPNWRILVLTFNRIAADLMRQALVPDLKLEVAHFHNWCWRLLERAGVEIPRMAPAPERSVYWNQVVPQLMLQSFKANQLPQARFDAILIDDGHDFSRSWYNVVLQSMNARPGSLFIVRDPREMSADHVQQWRDIGVQVSQAYRLTTNYRMPHQIFAATQALIAPAAVVDAGPPKSAPDILTPKGGFTPDVRRFPSAEAERKQALAWLRQRLSGTVSPDQILVLGLLRPEMAELETYLDDMGIGSRLIGGRSIPGVVRLATIHGAKGLEADFVLLLQAHQLEHLRRNDARRLLYTATTRARVQLAVYSHADSPLLEEFDAILNPRVVTPWDPVPRRPTSPAGGANGAKA